MCTSPNCSALSRCQTAHYVYTARAVFNLNKAYVPLRARGGGQRDELEEQEREAQPEYDYLMSGIAPSFEQTGRIVD